MGLTTERHGAADDDVVDDVTSTRGRTRRARQPANTCAQAQRVARPVQLQQPTAAPPRTWCVHPRCIYNTCGLFSGTCTCALALSVSNLCSTQAARSQKINKEEVIPPSPYPFLPPLPSPFPLKVVPLPRLRPWGAPKLPQRVRAEPGRQTHLSHFELSKTRPVTTDNMTSDEGI